MKKKKYLINLLITFLIIAVIFAIKGLFPFGQASLITGDLGEQITPMYYHFYDAVWSDNSLFISYATGNGINFFGNIGYYLVSPYTLLVLLFPRTMIPQAVNVIEMANILTCSFMFLYAIKKIFPKLNYCWAVLFAQLYAFSTYTMCLYLIPSFMTVSFMFPLIVLGLYYLANDKPKLYLGALTASMIMDFYLTVITLIFVLLAMNIYFILFKPANKKKCITNLGLTTILAAMISAVILLPTLLQIQISSRFTFSIATLMNSHMGPVLDKVTYFFSSGFGAGMFILLWKKDKKDPVTKLFGALLIMMLLPVLVEPINKMWHLGSYVFYPYRYGFITIFLFLAASAYYITLLPKEEENTSRNKALSIGITVFVCAVMAVLAKKFYAEIQKCMDLLTFTYDKKMFIIVFSFCILTFLATVLLFAINKNKGKMVFRCMSLVALVFTVIMGVCNFKIDYVVDTYADEYKDMNMLYQDNETDDYNTKIINYSFSDNNSMVSGYRAADTFTSLVNGSSFETMQRLGYDSYWMNTMSRGGNLFTDILQGDKYLLSGEEISDSSYKFIKQYNNLSLYQLNYSVSKGYLFKNNVSLLDCKNSFEASNKISNELMKQDIFTVYTDFDTHNLTDTDGNITIDGDNAYFEKTVQVPSNGILYFEIYNSFASAEKTLIYKDFDIYVNDQLLYENYPNKKHLDCVELGKFSNESVKVKVVVKKNCKISDISMGVLDTSKLSYFNDHTSDIKTTYHRNTADITYESSEDGILYLPINAMKGFTATLNGEKTDIVKVMDNYIGINVKKGTNTIHLSFVPDGLAAGAGISVLGIVFCILYNLWLKKNKEHPVLDTTANVIYTVVWYAAVVVVYAAPFIMFVISFI
jgi:uncharacterized membrane protein YfhO